MTSEKIVTKIDVKVGSITFSAEGEPEWLSMQLERVLAAASTAGAIKSEQEVVASPSSHSVNEAKFSTSLASHIKHLGGDKKQVRRFLAAADWLRRKGRGQIAASDVAKALLDNQQSRLANPADCLNKNVAKGFCEKVGKEFFITPEGEKELGYDG